MSLQVRRSPRLLERLLTQAAASETPKRSANATKRQIQLTVEESSHERLIKKRKKDFVDAAVEAVSSDHVLSSALNVAVYEANGEELEPALEGQVIIVTTKRVHYHQPAGYISRLRLILTSRGSYCIQVLLRVVEEGEVSTAEEFKAVCEKLADPRMKFCPGIPPHEYQQYKDSIRYDKKGVQITDEPFQRVSSVKCRLWFPLPLGGYNKEKKKSFAVLCRECVQLRGLLQADVRRLSHVTPEVKVQHQQADSFYPMKYLSPESLQKRKMNLKHVQLKERRMIKRYVPEEVILADKQHAEMSQIQSIVEGVASSELKSIFADGENHGTQIGATLRQTWEDDKWAHHEKAQKGFQEDQQQNRSGGKGNRWSPLTIRIALAVYVRSPAAYKALQSFDILKLPSKSTLQAYTGVFLNGPGASEDSIQRQAKQFKSFKEEQHHKNPRALQPKGDGVLIFDEVKVVSRLLWNSRNQEIIGLAMNPEDMSSLEDIYTSLDSEQPQQATYMLQFLWRDLTSKFDVMGPYYSSAESLKSKFVLACLYETLRLFQLYGFQTSVVVCDGASTNLTALKTTTGSIGAYGASTTSKHMYAIPSPKFENPFNPPNMIYWVICPSHQLKNMINSLYSSKRGGTKEFVFQGTNFGWTEIQKLYNRECERVDRGLARVVPKLREAYILRDSWTKLNVAPAKIMQQEEVLSELFSYTKSDPPPDDVESTKCTLKYLESCNLIFEKGLLSHERVKEKDAKILLNIQQGYSFFCDWLDNITKNDSNFSSTSPTQRKFLSWQTWDLLRIDIQGFTEFCHYFLSKYPGYFISPLRLSGSAIESVFGQFKFSAGGKLDAANYRVARAAFLTKQASEGHHSGKGYRDVSLSEHDITLHRKKYTHKSKKN